MKRLALALALFAAPAFAQQPAQMPSREKALMDELGNKMGENIDLRAALIEAQRQIATKDAQIKALEAKTEPKKD